ncbi:M48 family metallopeptidase [Streptomyces sp. IBSBF 2806]|uniref:M48 family metallopeptidase n=1 Tax=Streptomyces sp. IBSBF 2806 TaxID=2903529 RepID=UPI002FDC4D53
MRTGERGGGGTWLTVRAGTAVVLLAGVYVVPCMLVLALAAGAVLISTEGVNIATVKLAALALALATGTVAAVARTVVGRSGPQHGILVTSAEAPLLWNHVVLLAAEVGTRPPHEIRVTAEPNAYVVEHTRLLGLVRGRRSVCVGAPLLTALPVQSLTAVLGHELAHFSHLDTRLAVVTYGGRDLLARVVDAVPPGAPHRLVLQGYLHLYSLVSSSVLQRQEFLADRCAARVTDPGTAAAAIEKVHTAAADWQRFVGDHINPARTGRAPAGILPAFGRFLAAGGSGPAAWQPAPRPATWDTHPPLADRIEALLSDVPPADATGVEMPQVDRSWDLVPGLEHSARLDDLVLPAPGCTREPFDEHAKAVAVGRRQDSADALYRAAAEMHGGSEAGLPYVWELLAGGNGGRLHELLLRECPATAAGATGGTERLRQALQDAVVLAAVASGAACWRPDPVQGALPDITLPDLLPVSAGRLVDPLLVGAVRDQLRALGVDERRGRPSPGSGSDADNAGELIGALAVRLNNQPYDVLVHISGLYFLPANPHDMAWDTFGHRLAARLETAVHGPSEPGLFVAFRSVAAARPLQPAEAGTDLFLKDGTWLRMEEFGWRKRRRRRRVDPVEALHRGAEARAVVAALVERTPREPDQAPSRGRGAARVTATYRALAAVDLNRGGARRSSVAVLIMWNLVSAILVVAITAADSDEMMPFLPLFLGFFLVGALLQRTAARRLTAPPRPDGRRTQRRAARLAAHPAGPSPLRWAAKGVLASACCTPLGAYFAARAITAARRNGQRPTAGVLVLVLQCVVLVVAYALLL